MKLRIAKWSFLLGLFLALFHLSALGYVSALRWADAKIEAARTELVDTIAQQAGYERPPMEQLSTDDIIAREAVIAGVNPSLVRSLMRVESGGKSFAISPKGAVGLLQVMPFNAKRCGLSRPADLFDEAKNIRCGVQILSEELKTHGGDPVRALQAYNGGPGCVGKCAESLNHSRLVLAHLARDTK